jgi:hypothetical protein
MAKKSLIVYASWTGNTEKVALRFKKVLEKYGWECDMFKVDHHTDVKHPPFRFEDYDFICVGSPVVNKMPVGEVVGIIAGAMTPPSSGGPEAAFAGGRNAPLPDIYRLSKEREATHIHGKIDVDSNGKKGVVFMTYAGKHLGPKEVEPAISMLALEIEHIPFKCVGRFACPGTHGEDIPDQWFKDLSERPKERDLLKAEIFLEEILEEIE